MGVWRISRSSTGKKILKAIAEQEISCPAIAPLRANEIHQNEVPCFFCPCLVFESVSPQKLQHHPTRLFPKFHKKEMSPTLHDV